MPAFGEFIDDGAGFLDAEALVAATVSSMNWRGQFEAGQRGGRFGGIEPADLGGNGADAFGELDLGRVCADAFDGADAVLGMADL